jgi:excisionase family DNA binding protein
MTAYVRPGKAADMLGVSVDSISRYFDQGQLSGIRTPGGQRRIDRESVEAFKGMTTRPPNSEGK